MEIITYQMKNILWIEIPEELDQHISDIIRRKCEIILMDQKRKHIVFDFTRTGFMDSAGIGMIMGRFRQMHMRGGKVFIYRPGRRIVRLIEISGLKKYIEICNSMSEIDARLEDN